MRLFAAAPRLRIASLLSLLVLPLVLLSESCQCFVLQNQAAVTTSTTAKSSCLYSSNKIPSLYDVQEEAIAKRGEYEETIMTEHNSILEAYTPSTKGANAAGGFGAKQQNNKGNNKSALKAQGKEFAKVLRSDGVVRMDNVLSESTAAQLREYCFDLREKATEQVETGAVPSKQRFADVLLKENRCDLTMPLGDDIVYQALYQVLCTSPVGATLTNLLSKDAVLYEFSCLISDPGSPRQVVHPDTPCRSTNEEPVLYTTFVSLQDINLHMGPTIWLPGTHTVEYHELFQQEQATTSSSDDNTAIMISPKDKLLQTQPVKLGALPRGCCAMYDSRILHCGTANKSHLQQQQGGNDDGPMQRGLFYVSFQMPNTGYPGNPASIRPELAGKLTLGVLQKELTTYAKKGKPTPLLEEIASTLK